MFGGSLLRLSLGLALLSAAGAAAARPAPLGIFGSWGAFRDQARCYAISEPAGVRAQADAPRPFFSIGHWPHRRLSGQVHVRLSREKRPGSAVMIRIGSQRFQLRGAGREAWAPDAAADDAIIAAMRTGLELVVETRAVTGRSVRDHYTLRGAATAIDAAALACLR